MQLLNQYYYINKNNSNFITQPGRGPSLCFDSDFFYFCRRGLVVLRHHASYFTL